jgi:hypothetical protein
MFREIPVYQNGLAIIAGMGLQPIPKQFQDSNDVSK